MSLRQSLKHPLAQMRLGLLCLLAASLVRWFARPTHPMSADLKDGALGILYGMAIGMMLLSVYRRSRGNGSA